MKTGARVLGGTCAPSVARLFSWKRQAVRRGRRASRSPESARGGLAFTSSTLP